ncbi:MAG: hypothetical protein HC855_03255 [Rhizobiales bacterium]|nr:hypothetical protein [Hyphomicrobiales bacterium]
MASVGPPFQYAGPLRGGDPIWDLTGARPTGLVDYGTVAFVADGTRNLTVEGRCIANQAVTCSHVLNIPDLTRTDSTTNFPKCASLTWDTDPFAAPNGQTWIDLAGAALDAGVPTAPYEVRGLGEITGVKQPSAGIRVSKYGAASGLTSGKDLGICYALLHETSDGSKYWGWVRAVSGYFQTVGDSGAAILDEDRNLVGLVVAGTSEKDENYYIQAVPDGQATSVANISAFKVNGF